MKKLNNKEFNVLGVSYVLRFKSEEEDEKLTIMDGYFDYSSKEIVCGIFKRNIDSCKNLYEYAKSVIRHEIIHAFLYESGLYCNSSYTTNWACNEEMVDWIALQFPKIQKLYEELELC